MCRMTPKESIKKFWEVKFLNKYVNPAEDVEKFYYRKSHLFEGINFEKFLQVTVEEIEKRCLDQLK